MKELQNLEEVGGRTSPEDQGRGLWWSVRRDPDLVFCFRAVRSTCAAPRVTCWWRTGGEDVWTSTMSRTMQIVAAPQLPGEGREVTARVGQENKGLDCLGSHGKISWDGLLPP